MKTPTHAAALALLLAAGATSCVVVATDTDHDISGQYVSKSTLAQIEPGESQDYVMAILGDPTSRTVVDEYTEIWRWRYKESKSSSAHILLLIDNDKTSDVEHSTFVEFENGVVRKAWRD